MKSKLKDKASNPNKVATANHLRGNLAASSREATVNLSKAVTVVLHRPSPDTRLNKAVVSRVGTVLRRHHQDID